ncbi:baseplate J/gp47 family protein [Bradyrhizobium sp.]|jgi:hypothetical protein|uniref:baseplate J/gp47 family protein n=1 Tax=Bradyrhizobium sp. TaxID=376 RepID=UPI002E0AEEF6|nr:baseplate J/gp47 family protein [Bradyrhizobium sp.]
MSRPPRPAFRNSPAADQPGRFDYLPLEYADFLDLAVDLAREEAGIALPTGDSDVTRTLIEMPALLAHVLATYQDLYARESFLSTARTARGLIRHARRLAYEPDGGLAATGHVRLVVKDGLAGTVPAGFALGSSPLGDVKAQTFETLAPLDVDARWNAILPAAATIPMSFAFAGGQVAMPLAGTDLRLEIGEVVLLEGPAILEPFRVVAVAENTAASETVVTLATLAGLPALPPADAAAHAYRLLAKPAADLRVFGWNADPVLFPPANVAAVAVYTPPPVGDLASKRYGYDVTADFGALTSRLMLADAVEEPLKGQPIVMFAGTTAEAFVVADEGPATVALRRGEVVSSPVVSTEDGAVTIESGTAIVESSISATVTALTLKSVTGTAKTWSTFPIRSRVLGRWRQQIPVAATRPNPAAVSQPLVVAADLAGMRPGRSLALSSLDEARVQVATLTRFTTDPATGTSTVEFQMQKPDVVPAWTLGDLQIFGNVARISHGETVDEVLGGSDGVSAFQRFSLKKPGVTAVPGATGGELALKVWVGGVRWKRVEDFHAAISTDRIYRIERNQDGGVEVIFGGEGKGAIPPAGKKNVTATYRVGLGADGNVDRGRVARVKKPAPILQRATNPKPISGGAAAAGIEDIRTQSTRFIRTFDRAVSVQDHADLALLFPGVVRAAARWSDDAGIELVVATAAGIAPEAIDAMRAFMDARRDTSVRLTVHGPLPVDVLLSLVVTRDPAFLKATVQDAVREALLGDDELAPGLFSFAQRGFGEAVPLSAVYQAADRAAGVIAVRVIGFDIAPGTAARDLVRATARQWLRLPQHNLEITVATEPDIVATIVGEDA